MLQRGKVLHTEGAYALVHMEKGKGCGGERCPLSAPFINDARSDFYTVRARNDIHASPGDMVLVEVQDQTILAIAFFLYIIPLLFAFSVYALLRFFFSQELIAISGLLGSVGASFLLLRRLNKQFAIEYRIVDLVNPRECTQCPLFLRPRR
ncbi:MAG: SoxR reducing system RseC family protein [Candidatus Caldatribacterium sp.]|uniref:SoxR reducing system RseC family protein n=1 Tax=Candidatus Caldatribacterium sp. TaxID=2282143 RepID=UPI00299239A4|nr:SoxR reducing system RseC family protein [Candidatus Caldatribacterium sp.]MCX7730299.1 SoxR reducing system RseC family protein [Candidatus Caldatribacterium sp.]MDW8080359.1 SoxR reducing system RseC family protein [Candidatus Calescibacterium sp.]